MITNRLSGNERNYDRNSEISHPTWTIFENSDRVLIKGRMENPTLSGCQRFFREGYKKLYEIFDKREARVMRHESAGDFDENCKSYNVAIIGYLK